MRVAYTDFALCKDCLVELERFEAPRIRSQSACARVYELLQVSVMLLEVLRCEQHSLAPRDLAV
jgi:hypothetical protein